MIIDYIIFSLAQSFLRSLSSTNRVSAVAQGFLMNYDLFPFLARNFFRMIYSVFYFIYLKVISYLLESSLARNFGSSARLLSFPTPESYSCTSRIREGQVTKQLTKKTAKNFLIFGRNLV